MSRAYRVRGRADAEADRIADYLGARRPEVGERFLRSVRRDYAFLAEHPNAGAVRTSAIKAYRALRSWPVGGFHNYLIFYLPKRNGVEIVRVLHGARDIARLFRET